MQHHDSGTVRDSRIIALQAYDAANWLAVIRLFVVLINALLAPQHG